MAKQKLNLQDGLHQNIAKLAKAIGEQAEEKGQTHEQLAMSLLNELVGNELVDGPLEENMIAGLAQDYGLLPVNPEHEFNAEALGIGEEDE